MVQCLLKLLLKQRILSVYHDFYRLLVATKLLTAKLHSCYAKGSEILGRSQWESFILSPTPQPYFQTTCMSVTVESATWRSQSGVGIFPWFAADEMRRKTLWSRSGCDAESKKWNSVPIWRSLLTCQIPPVPFAVMLTPSALSTYAIFLVMPLSSPNMPKNILIILFKACWAISKDVDWLPAASIYFLWHFYTNLAFLIQIVANFINFASVCFIHFLTNMIMDLANNTCGFN